MVTQEILDYIRNQKKQGKDVKAIRDALVASGWKKEDVEEGIKHIMIIDNDITPLPLQQTQVPKDPQMQNSFHNSGKKKIILLIFLVGVTLGVLMFAVMSLEPALFGRQPSSSNQNGNVPSSTTPGYTPQRIIPVVPGPGAGT